MLAVKRSSGVGEGVRKAEGEQLSDPFRDTRKGVRISISNFFWAEGTNFSFLCDASLPTTAEERGCGKSTSPKRRRSLDPFREHSRTRSMGAGSFGGAV